MHRDLVGKEWDYRLECGLLSELGAILAGFAKRCVVITDENVAEHWKAQLLQGLANGRSQGLDGVLELSFNEVQPQKLVHHSSLWQSAVIVLPAGEKTKSLDSARRLYDILLNLGIDRDTAIVAFGGGVVGDLAGFVASTVLRGVPFIQVPTTLLAMVDSSLGGKTGVNAPQGKNLVGSFYGPQVVIADIMVLSTLPEREWANGIAEVLKVALVGDPELFRLMVSLSVGGPIDDAGVRHMLFGEIDRYREIKNFIGGAAKVKIDIVSSDPYEHDKRVLLNLGHTFGHALEAAGHYELLSHGEAVGIGIIASMKIAEELGMLQEDLLSDIKTIMRFWGLPLHIPAEITWEDTLKHLAGDKKKTDGELVFVLPCALGRAELVSGISEIVLQEVFQALKSC